MNETENAEFSGLIEARLREIAEENALGHSGQGVVTLDQQSVGRLSRMDALQNQAMAKAQQTRRDAEETRLRDALERIAMGDCGRCDDCDAPIPKGRLRLDLAARLCVPCASG